MGGGERRRCGQPAHERPSVARSVVSGNDPHARWERSAPVTDRSLRDRGSRETSSSWRANPGEISVELFGSDEAIILRSAPRRPGPIEDPRRSGSA